MKRATLILILILGTILPLFPVEAQTGDLWVNLELENVYGLRGETINITSNTNYGFSSVRIFDPQDVMIYSQTWPANDTRQIPISQSADYGTYRIVGRVPSVKTETWFTVLDITGWNPVTTWPHVVDHKGLEYSFYKNWTIGVRLYNDVMNIDLSTIRKLSKAYNMDVSPKSNDMNFLVRFTKGATKIDLNFAFIHTGAKLIINGTLDHARDISINFDAQNRQIRKRLNGLRIGNIVFDWADVLGGEWWTYLQEEKELMIHAPQNFRIDPVVFSDGFESGDFTEQTSTTEGGTGSISVQGAIVHHGSYAARAQSSAAADDAYAHKTFGDETDVYARTEFYLDSADMGDNWDYVFIYELWDVGSNPALQIRLQNRNDDGLPSLVAIVNSPYSITDLGVDFSYDTWTCIELHFLTDASVGVAQVWVDEGLELDQTGLDTSGRTVDGINVGINSDGATGLHAVDLEIDCEVVAEEYIGPESANTAPVNDVMSITDLDDSDNIYAEYRNYTLDYDGHDADGYADVDEILLNITQGATVRASFKYDEDTNTFSIFDGDDKFEIETDLCSATRTGNNLNLTVRFRAEWDATAEDDCELKAYIVDDEPESDTDTLQTDYCDIVTDLVTTFSFDDDRGNLEQSITASGAITYTGSSLYPADDQFTSVSVYDSLNNNEGTDSSIVNGAWGITFTAPATVEIDTYNLYINGVGDYPDGEETSPTDTFITDQIVVYWETLDDARVNVDTNIEGRYRAVLDYDETDLGSGDSLSVGWGALSWDAGNSWFDISHSESSVGAVTVSGWTGTEATYTVTSIIENITEASYIYDRQQLQTLDCNDTTPNPNQPVEMWLTSESEYDAHVLTSGDSITLKDSATNLYVFTWNGTMFTNVTSWAVNATYNLNTYDSVSEVTYGITVLNMNSLSLSITVGEVPPPSGYNFNLQTIDSFGVGIQAVNVELDNGTLIVDEDTNSTGFIAQQNIQADNYTLTIVKDGYITYNHTYEIEQEAFWVIKLFTVEEGAVVTTTVNFTLELLVLAAVSMIFTLMMLFSSQPGMGVIAGSLAFVFWEATGLYYMYTNIADQYAIGYLFIGLGLICVIMTVYCGLRTLDPKAASKDSDFL